MAEQERVAAEQPDHVLAGLGRLDEQLRVLRQRVGVRGLGAGPGQLPEPVGELRARHHQVGPGEQLGGPHRQQALVSWAGADEGDPAVG